MFPRRLLIVLYTASGAAALVYEVVWTRLLTLQLGHTVAAATTVLAAFMGGLAAGAWIGGRLLRGQVGRVSQVGQVAQDQTHQTQQAHPTYQTHSAYLLRLYAALEIAIAACALALPFALRGTVPLLAWAYADGTAPIRFGLLRVAISLTLVGIPAAAMGATFPIAADWLSSSRAQRSPASVLYAANTVGAALGALAAGFWLIPAVGLRATTGVGVALNVVAAVGAWWISKPHAELAEHAESTEPKKTRADATPKTRKALRVPRVLRETFSPSPRLAWMAVSVSGFSALVYEVAWIRLLALVIGPTTYAFSTMAAAFIAGLALGSAAGTPLSRRATRPSVWLAWMLIAGAIASMTAAWYAAARLPFVVAAQVGDPAAAFSNIVGAQALAVGLLLLPSTMALGATFPLALAVRRRVAVARDAARVRANTLGAFSARWPRASY
jgi:spermidine synthase